MKHFVLIKSYEDDSVVKRIECPNEKSAIRTANGMDINLNHEKFYTEVVEEDGKPWRTTFDQ